MKIVKLYPNKNSKYHFGETGLDDSLLYFPSPSLFSAIVNNFVKLYGEKEVDNLLKIRISSLFPAYKEVYFVPKPFLKILPEELQSQKPKLSKRIQFISLSYLKEINNPPKDITEKNVVQGFLFSNRDKEMLNGELPKILFEKDFEIKINLSKPYDSSDIKDSKSGPYEVFYIYPGEKVYFYFLLDDSELSEDTKEKLIAAINLIQDEGLGGERGTGAGAFDKLEIQEEKEFSEYIRNIENPLYHVTLSMVIPKDQDEFNEFESYALIKRSGYIFNSKTTNLRKKEVYAIKEGSIFKSNVYGKVVDVSPEPSIKIYQYGKCFALPIAGGKND
ncbi:MAG: type III-A CRISPR-associated RAMP protein Csm4 [Caldisericum sp.]|uniref:type III-A CRISPR-associated RAMP protein Csm4 n=1 Tax=Caldisericum sp. TaxID=2499687 RepID=UPI003D13BD85